MTKLVAATNNKGKIKEIKAILGGLGFEVVSQSELGLDLDVEETGTTFTENALLKARAAAQASGIPAIADDSGLCVDALGGAPGVYSARYAGEGATDAMLIEKLLKNMEGVEKEKRGCEVRERGRLCDTAGRGIYRAWRGGRPYHRGAVW